MILSHARGRGDGLLKVLDGHIMPPGAVGDYCA